jgi:hypothetical protein
MASSLQIAIRQMHLGLLWGASLLVPGRERAEWSHEWRTELWYVLRECFSETSATPRSIREATRFCMGAYQDAICLRGLFWRTHQPLARVRRSAAACLLLLVGIFFAVWGLARTSTRVAAGISRIQAYPWRMSGERSAPCDCALDLVTTGRLLGTTQLFFDGFSHYRIAHETVWAEAVPRTEWTVAHANANFFAVLHLPARSLKPAAEGSDRLPQVVLSHDTWIRDFGGNTNIAGARLHVGSLDAMIAGVASDSSTGLPGDARAWVLSSDPQIASDNEEFVVGHLSPVGYFNDGRWALSVGSILLAFLVLPFITRLSLGEYGSGTRKPSLATRSRFWTFLLSKIALVVAIIYYGSFDLACLLVHPFSPSSEYVQCASSVVLCVLTLRWAFRDQQRRCPICLGRMAHPVEVGQPSRTFLAWNGTELVCECGHTLLHIPEVSTSWFAAQRWVYLDRSWQFLFARSNG